MPCGMKNFIESEEDRIARYSDMDKIFDKEFLKNFKERIDFYEDDLQRCYENFFATVGDIKDLLEDENVSAYMEFDEEAYAEGYPDAYYEENGISTGEKEETEKVLADAASEADEENTTLLYSARNKLIDLGNKIDELEQYIDEINKLS